MLNKFIHWIGTLSLLCLMIGFSHAGSRDDGLGQTIQIYTRFHSFVGKPSWLLMIRDLDHGQNIPYLYDIRKGNNFWLAFTYSRNYLISVSNLQIETYKSRFNKFKLYKIHDFCNLESDGRIIKGESMYITIEGNLTPNTGTFTCHVSKYLDTNFAIASPNPAP